MAVPTEIQRPLRARLLARDGLRADVATRVRESIPTNAWLRWDAAKFRVRWGFEPPPMWADWSGYHRFLALAEQHGLPEVPGDVVEIGVLLGGGTYTLCQWYARHAPDKHVIAVDIFDPSFDLTPSTGGDTMAELYNRALAGRDQRSVFDEVTAPCTNLTVIEGDSAQVELPCERIAFGYVDGNHSAAYVRSDFEKVWEKLSPGGIVAFDDYGADIPEVTRTLHEVVGEHAGEVARVWVDQRTFVVQRG